MAARNRIRVIGTVAGLLALLVLLVYLAAGRRSTVGAYDRDLVLAKPGNVTSISLESPNGSLILDRENGKWTGRDNEEVNQTAVENLLFALSHFRMTNLMDDGKADIQKEVTLTCFAGKKQVLAYRMSFINGTTWISLDEKKQLLGVSLPGFPDLDLEHMFDPGSAYLLNRLLLNIEPDNIREINVLPYKGTPFMLRQDSLGNLRFFLEPGDSELNTGQFDERKVRRMLSYFKGIVSDGKFNGEAGNSVAIVALTDKDGTRNVLEIFALPQGDGKADDLFRAVVRFNSGKELLVVRYFYLDVLIRGAEHYFSVPDPVGRGE